MVTAPHTVSGALASRAGSVPGASPSLRDAAPGIRPDPAADNVTSHTDLLETTFRLIEEALQESSPEAYAAKAIASLEPYAHMLGATLFLRSHGAKREGTPGFESLLQRIEAWGGDEVAEHVEQALGVMLAAQKLSDEVEAVPRRDPARDEVLIDGQAGWAVLHGWSLDALAALATGRAQTTPAIAGCIVADLRIAARWLYAVAAQRHRVQFGDPDDEDE